MVRMRKNDLSLSPGEGVTPSVRGLKGISKLECQKDCSDLYLISQQVEGEGAG